MGAPNVVIANQTIGRRGHFTAAVEWTAEDAADLDNAVVLDPAWNASGKYGNTRFKVLNARYDCDDGVEARLEFDVTPLDPAGLILQIAGGATSGQKDFVRESLQGSRPDPNRDTPSKIVLSTLGAVPGNALFLECEYEESGVRPN